MLNSPTSYKSAVLTPLSIREKLRWGFAIGGSVGCLLLLLWANTTGQMWLGGQVMLLVVACGLLLHRVRLPAVEGRLVLIVVIALLLRGFNLEYAIHRHVDELISIDSLVQVWDDPNTRLLVPYTGVAAFSRLYTALQSITVAAFGENLTGLRVISAIFGALGVAAVYGLAGVLFGKRTAWLAALMLAVMPVHLHFSRLGINNIADPLFGTLALAFLARGQRDGVLSDFVAAGVMLGLTQYFYEGGRLLYPGVVLAFALIGRPLALREAAALIWTAVLVAFPVYAVLWLGDLPVAPRLRATMQPSGDWLAYMEGFRDAISFYVYQPDAGWFYGGRLVMWWLLPLLVAGLWWCIRHGMRHFAGKAQTFGTGGGAMGGFSFQFGGMRPPPSASSGQREDIESPEDAPPSGSPFDERSPFDRLKK